MKPILAKLIGFQTDQYHPRELKNCADYVKALLKKSGLPSKMYFSQGKYSLITAKKLKKHYQYILCGHLDVVPADYPKAFTPVIKGDRLYGRGAADMKGVDAAMIKLMLSSGLKYADAALMLTTDEEIGGFNGVRFLIEKQGIRCDCAIVPDGGKNFELVLAEKGVLHVKLTAKGKSAHGSRPWVGDNAIEKLISAFQFIKTNMPETDFNNLWKPSVNLGKLAGGDAANKVPGRAEMYLDFRFPENKDRTIIKKLLNKAVKKHQGLAWKPMVEGDILKTSPKNKYVKKMLKTAEALGIKMEFDKCHGASDGRYFSAHNIPVLMFAPKASAAHIDNEWVDLKSLNKFYMLLKNFLKHK
jgi:succinyl-diaminopimelate desuccinylase